jgi:hypothetical protein
MRTNGVGSDRLSKLVPQFHRFLELLPEGVMCARPVLAARGSDSTCSERRRPRQPDARGAMQLYFLHRFAAAVSVSADALDFGDGTWLRPACC